MEYSAETRRIFIAQDNGTISEFSLSEDFNRLLARREYLGKLLSISREREFYVAKLVGRQ